MPNAHKAGYLRRALVASLLFHALIISLQFGEPVNGLPWLDLSREAASSIQAVLIAPAPAPIAPSELDMSAMASRRSLRPRSEARQEKLSPPPAQVPALTQAATVSLHKAEDKAAEISEPARPVVAAVEQKAQVAPNENSILSTQAESSWTVPVAPQVREEEVPARPAAPEKARNVQPQEAEKLPQAVAASQEAAERKRVDEQAKLEQAKLEQAKLEQTKLEQTKLEQAKLEQAKLEQAKLEQAKLEQAKLEQGRMVAEKQAAVARQEAAERKRIEEQARVDSEKQQQAAMENALREAMERARAGELARARQVPTGGGGQERTGRSESQGASLARRALDQARSGFPGPPLNLRPDSEQRRRAGILGADPRNIQLAFYGEGWRQKVERIGSLNYPRVSKDRFYEPLVVTVSINSDGSLASLHIDKSSGQRDMDDAVRRIVEMSAPFSAFPPDLKRNYDVIEITRTWVFDERPRMISQ